MITANDIKVKIFKKDLPGSKLVANGQVTFFDSVNVQFSIWSRSTGMSVSFPYRTYEKNGEKQYFNEVSFIDADTEKFVQKTILEAYEKRAGVANVTAAVGEEGDAPAPKTNRVQTMSFKKN